MMMSHPKWPKKKNASWKTIPKLMLTTILGNTDILRYF